MLTSLDYRQRAWNALSGQWGTLALSFFIVYLVTGVVSSFVPVLSLIFAGPIYYGLSVQALNVVRGRRVEVSDVMAAQNRLPETILAFFINGLFTFLWALLFIVPGIIAAYSYSMTYYIMIDNPNLTPDAARRKSMELMKGNKLGLFYLQLSFLGWILLCVLTFGILTLWVAPYMQCAIAEFYQSLIMPYATTDQSSGKIDPFDNGEGKTDNAKKPDEPFYVFEEEMPRETPDSFDTNILGKK